VATLNDKIAAFDAANQAALDAAAKSKAAIDAAGSVLITRADPSDESIDSGQAKNHPSRPEVLANVGGNLHVLQRID
jgi:hypothetical protein